MIKIFPEIILRAANNNKSVCAYRVWFIAKDFDKDGCGIISKRDFRQHLLQLGISRASAYRWLEMAIELGLFKHLGKAYSLVSWENGADIAGIGNLLRPVYMDIEKFVNKGWMSFTWACYLKHFEDKPIARATLRELSGVPERTQRDYERSANVINRANYANFGHSNSIDEAVYPDAEKGYYAAYGEIRRRLPNSRSVPDGIVLANKGRTRQINRKLAALYFEDSDLQYPGRLYCLNDKQVKQALRDSRKQNAIERPDFAFLKSYKTDVVEVYNAFAL